MADDPTTPEAPAARPFGAWLQEHTNGALHAELTETMRELVTACQEHGKAGTITLAVKVKPAEGQSTAMFVEAEVKSKPPVGDRPSALFFADSDGNLSRRDPRQPELPLREVSSDRKAG